MDAEKIKRFQDISMVMTSLNIETPQIVVLGSQSSGKSSVLEQMIGKEILPCGASLTTRCPIVLHLRRCREEREYVVFDHLSEPVYDFSVSKKIIIERMEKMCGVNKGISSSPITMFVNMNNTFEMTLVDLPGLVKVPTGEQPEDIEVQIETMALRYTEKRSAIILALVNANTDIATNEALKIAMKVDPGLERTLGVVTKIDLMDSGTDCMAILRNKHPQLVLGYVGVINRGQQEMAKNVSLEDSILKERMHFMTDSVYKQLYPSIGSEYLVKRLREIFCRIVVESLPTIRATLKAQLNDKMQKIREMGPVAERGTFDGYSLVLLYHQVLQDIFRRSVSENRVFTRNASGFLGNFKNVFREKNHMFNFSGILSQLQNSSYLFISEATFEDIVRNNVKHMLEFYLEKINRVVKLLCEEISSISSASFEALAKKLNSVTCEYLEVQHAKLLDEVRVYAKVQSSYIDIEHPDFDKIKALNTIFQQTLKEDENILDLLTRSEVSLEGKRFESNLMKELATAYLNIVSKEMRSYVIKAAHYHLCRYIDTDLLNVIVRMKLDDAILTEPFEVTRKRMALEKDLELLEYALSVLSEL